MLYNIIVALIVIICVLLTVVVLLQPGQGQGLSGGLAGGMGQGGPNMGARRTADLLSKSTSILGGAFLVLCVLANFAINRGGQNESAVQQSGATSPPTEQNIDFDNPSETPSAVPQSSSESGNSGGSDNSNSDSDN